MENLFKINLTISRKESCLLGCIYEDVAITYGSSITHPSTLVSSVRNHRQNLNI